MLHINFNLARETLVTIVPPLGRPIRPPLSRTIRLLFQPIFPVVEVEVSPNQHTFVGPHDAIFSDYSWYASIKSRECVLLSECTKAFIQCWHHANIIEPDLSTRDKDGPDPR
jgi:hypothetical protein